MNRNTLTVLLASLALFAVAIPMSAHHSFAAAYDMTKEITVTGVIVQVRLENPHSWFFLDVKGTDGKTEKWSFEAGTPSGMIRNGFKPGEIKAGTVVTIKGYHARDARSNRFCLSAGQNRLRPCSPESGWQLPPTGSSKAGMLHSFFRIRVAELRFAYFSAFYFPPWPSSLF